MKKNYIDNLILEGFYQIIEESKIRNSSYVNISLTLLYWDVGRYINQEVLRGPSRMYGCRAMKQFSDQLMVMYGGAFSLSNLYRMVKFSRVFPNRHIVATLSPKISWSAFVTLITIKDRNEIAHRILRVLDERLSVRKLRERIDFVRFTSSQQSQQITINSDLLDYFTLDKVDPDLSIEWPLIAEIKRVIAKNRSRFALSPPSRVLLTRQEMVNVLNYECRGS